MPRAAIDCLEPRGRARKRHTMSRRLLQYKHLFLVIQMLTKMLTKLLTTLFIMTITL
jgi:hypothetical protein